MGPAAAPRGWLGPVRQVVNHALESTLEETIVAVGSPPGRSARGLVRGSGSDLPAVLRRMQVPEAGDGDPWAAPGRVHRCALAWSGEDPLPVLMTCYCPPRSYTGQAMVEWQLPGHPALLQRVLDRAVACGARGALPGEFTYRRFMAGKIDLTQAEGVAATIAAVSDAQLDAASRLRAGALGGMAARFVGELANALALVESAIDFTDQEDVVPLPRPVLVERLKGLQDALRDLLDGSMAWARLDALPRVVLIGAPSVGKSTLFNALLGRERMVTAKTWGTTRDRVSEPLHLVADDGRPFEVLLEDVPGIAEASGLLQRRMRGAAETALGEADLVLALDDGYEPPVGVTSGGHADVIRVRSKSDLSASSPRPVDLAVSAVTGAGLDVLRRVMADRLSGLGISVEGAVLVLQARHVEHLEAARRDLSEVQDRLEAADAVAIEEPELVAAAMRAALDQLASLGGAVTPDDVIGRIFAAFCVGK